MPSATPPTSAAARPGASACSRSRRDDRGHRAGASSARTRTRAPTPAAAVSPRRGVHGDASGAADQSTRSPGVEPLRERAVSPMPSGAPASTPRTIAQRRSGASTSRSVSDERAPQRAGRHGADEHEVAEAGLARAPAHERVADLADVDRAAERPAPPDDGLVGHDVFDLRLPPERQPPRAEGEGRAPGREEDHSAHGGVEGLGDDDGVAEGRRRDDRRESTAMTLLAKGTVTLRQRPSHTMRSPNSESRAIVVVPLSLYSCGSCQAVCQSGSGRGRRAASLRSWLPTCQCQRHGREHGRARRARRTGAASGCPRTAAASGYRLVAVIPGSVFTSSRVTASGSPSSPTTKSTRDRSRQPRAACACTATLPGRGR